MPLEMILSYLTAGALGFCLGVALMDLLIGDDDDLPPMDGNVLMVSKAQLESIIKQRVRATMRKIREIQKEVPKPEAWKQPQPTA